jgi:hypothetical protein
VKAFLIAMAIALGGCASNISAYTRADGVPVDPLHQQATLAQCKGEGVSGPALTDGTVYGAVAQAKKESTLVDACMARNGYIHAQQ